MTRACGHPSGTQAIYKPAAMMTSLGWLLSLVMLLISLGIGAYGSSLILNHRLALVGLGDLAVGALGIALAFRVFRKWRVLRAGGQLPATAIMPPGIVTAADRKELERRIQVKRGHPTDGLRAGRLVWLVVSGLSALVGLLALVSGVIAGRQSSAVLGAGLLVRFTPAALIESHLAALEAEVAEREVLL